MTKREWKRKLESLETRLQAGNGTGDEFQLTDADRDALNESITPPTATVSEDIEQVTTEMDGRQSETTETDSRTLTPREKAMLDVTFRPSDSFERFEKDGPTTANRNRETAETGDTGTPVDDSDGGTDTDTDDTDGSISHETTAETTTRSAKVGSAKFRSRREYERDRRHR